MLTWIQARDHAAPGGSRSIEAAERRAHRSLCCRRGWPQARQAPRKLERQYPSQLGPHRVPDVDTWSVPRPRGLQRQRQAIASAEPIQPPTVVGGYPDLSCGSMSSSLDSCHDRKSDGKISSLKDSIAETPRRYCSILTFIRSIMAAISRCSATDGSGITSSRSLAALMCGITVERDSDSIHNCTSELFM